MAEQQKNFMSLKEFQYTAVGTGIGVVFALPLTLVGLIAFDLIGGYIMSKIKTPATIEQKTEAEEVIDVEYLNFKYHPDTYTKKQFNLECMQRWIHEKNKCKALYPKEIAACEKEASKGDRFDMNYEINCIDRIISSCIIPHEKKRDECRSLVYREGFMRYQLQKNIQRR